MNVTTHFQTLLFIDSATNRSIKTDMQLKLDIIDYINQDDKKDIFYIDSYNILDVLLGIIYIENSYEVVKEIIIGDIQEIIDKFIEHPEYDWYKIIRDWGLGNSIRPEFRIFKNETANDYGAIKVSLEISNNQVIGFGNSKGKARRDAAYKYIQQHIPDTEIEKYIPNMSFNRYQTRSNRTFFSRKKELAEIEDIKIEDEWMLNQCFVHQSYIKENESLKYESNESLSYLGNHVRYLIVDKLIYENRMIFIKKFKHIFIQMRRGILHPRVNVDLFLEMNLDKYMLIEDNYKVEDNPRTGASRNAINAILGAIFISDNNLNNRFIEIYRQHIINSLPEIQGRINEAIIDKANRRDNNDSNIVDKQNNIIESIQDYSQLFNTDNSLSFTILDGHESVNQQMIYLANNINIKNINIATGFMYKSGLIMLEEIIEKVNQNQGKVELLIGSLQKYNDIKERNSKEVIMGMDKSTANYLNMLIGENKVNIKTLEERFYHGKFFMLEGEEKSCFIIGSSNVSNSAFNLNRELNLLYIVKNNDDNYSYFKEWYSRLSQESVDMEGLEEKYFNDSEVSYINNYLVSRVGTSEFLHEINNLTDEEIKFRLNLWIGKRPSSIYNELGVDSLKGYYLFKYKENDLIVLESFEPQNSFYCFKNWGIEELLSRIKNLSKTDIFELSDMDKRGYHITDRSKLESNINIYFIKEYS